MNVGSNFAASATEEMGQYLKARVSGGNRMVDDVGRTGTDVLEQFLQPRQMRRMFDGPIPWRKRFFPVEFLFSVNCNQQGGRHFNSTLSETNTDCYGIPRTIIGPTRRVKLTGSRRQMRIRRSYWPLSSRISCTSPFRT